MYTHKQTLMLHGLRYATYTFVALTAVIGIVSLFTYMGGDALQGRIVPDLQGNPQIPRTVFSAQQAVEGFTAPASTHIMFSVPDGVRIPAITFLGGQEAYERVRYWYYCFSGNESRNRAENRRGREVYDGVFGFSAAERRMQQISPSPGLDPSDIFPAGNGNTLHAPVIFQGGELCYLMTEAPLRVGIISP